MVGTPRYETNDELQAIDSEQFDVLLERIVAEVRATVEENRQ